MSSAYGSFNESMAEYHLRRFKKGRYRRLVLPNILADGQETKEDLLRSVFVFNDGSKLKIKFEDSCRKKIVFMGVIEG